MTLTGFELDDASEHLAGEDSEQIRRFGFPRPSTRQGVEQAIKSWQESWRSGGAVRAFAVRETRTGQLVGGCELRLKSQPPARVSYWTLKQHRGHGYSSRALPLLVRYAFDVVGVTELEAEIEPDNWPSRRVAEKAGFALRAGLFRLIEFSGEHRPVTVYSRRATATRDVT